MSKVKENKIEATTAITFAEVMKDKAQPSLKAIADVLGVPPQRLYSVAKQPMDGEVYDARKYNWDAIGRFIAKRIGAKGDAFGTFEEVYDAAIAKDAENGASDKRHGSRGSSKVMIDLPDGKQMPARRKDLAIGDIISLKKSDEKLEVKFLTTTHVCFQVVGTEQLTCLSNWTLNQKLPSEKNTVPTVVVEQTAIEA